MSPKVLLRISSIVIFLHDLGHTLGFSSWKLTPDAAKLEVIKQMTVNKFPFMGAVHSMGDYYEGFGFAASLALLLIAAILWIVSGSTTQNQSLITKILVVIAIFLLAWGIDELIYFFPFAAAFSLLAMALTTVAVFQINRHAR
jgi:hypothetical protein